MVVVRYVTLLTLVIWLGGMIMLGALVAPATFGVLQAADPAAGRVLAGALFGEILRIFHLIAFGCGVLMILALLATKFIGPPPSGFFARLGLVVVMLALEGYAAGPVTREISGVQAQVSGPINGLPEADPRRLKFDRLHQTSTALMAVNMTLGLVLLFWLVRD